MLTHLSLKYFAVVRAAELEFGPGMTVISGETGAGKSLLVDALGFLCGARADAGAVRHGAERAGLPHMDIVSGAGHDAVYVARTAPTSMIFVPCKDGISHNEIEDASPEHLAAGCNVLLHAMLEQAGVAG